MDLWIRSQDRKELRPQPKLGIEKIVNGWCIIDRYNFYDSYSLGTYKSEERALEVLDEIQNILKPRCIVDTSSINFDGKPYESKSVILQDCNANARIEKISTFVYEMPKE